jgi:hypothetical protein
MLLRPVTGARSGDLRNGEMVVCTLTYLERVDDPVVDHRVHFQCDVVPGNGLCAGTLTTVICMLTLVSHW